MFAPHIRIKDVIGDGAERESRGGVNRGAGTVLQFLSCYGEPIAIPLPLYRRQLAIRQNR